MDELRGANQDVWARMFRLDVRNRMFELRCLHKCLNHWLSFGAAFAELGRIIHKRMARLQNLLRINLVAEEGW